MLRESPGRVSTESSARAFFAALGASFKRVFGEDFCFGGRYGCLGDSVRVWSESFGRKFRVGFERKGFGRVLSELCLPEFWGGFWAKVLVFAF